MEILKIWRHAESGEEYLKSVIDYVLNDRKVLWQCYGVQVDHPTAIYQQMVVVSDFFGNHGKNQVFHFVISFDKETVSNAFEAHLNAKKVFSHLLDDHLMIISIHKENHVGSLYHAHILLSSTNYLSGELWQIKFNNLFTIGQNVANITHNTCLLELPKFKGDAKPLTKMFFPKSY